MYPREPDNTEFGTNPTRQKRGRKSNLLEQSTIFLSILVQMHFQEFKKVLSSRIASAQKPGVFRLTRISRSLEVTLTSKRHAQANRHRSRDRSRPERRWVLLKIPQCDIDGVGEESPIIIQRRRRYQNNKYTPLTYLVLAFCFLPFVIQSRPDLQDLLLVRVKCVVV